MDYQDYARDCLKNLMKQTPSAQNVRDVALLSMFLEPSPKINDVQQTNNVSVTKEVKSTLEIDGDSEFEQILLKIKPNQYKEMIKVFNSLVNDVQIINNRAYLAFIDKLKRII